MIRTAALTLFLSLTLAAAGAAADPAGDERDLDLASFDRVWTTIRDTHWDPEMGGLDWSTVRDELRPRVASAATREEARTVISEMIGRLGQSHFGLIPRDLYDDLEPEADEDEDGGKDADGGPVEEGRGSVGIDLRVIDGEVLVSRVDEGSPADGAGIRAGWVVEAIDGIELAPLVESALEAHDAEVIFTHALLAKLEGPIGATRALRLRDGDDTVVDLEVAVADEPGERVGLGYLTPMNVWTRTRSLPSGVGAFAFSAFLDPGRVMAEFNRAMASFATSPGVIVDVRGNPGGIGAMAMGMAAAFIADKGLKLGTMTTRETSLDFVVYPRPRVYSGPLAVLVDGLSASTAEIFAGGLQDIGRARVFGSRTAGMALPSRVERLPNGDGFQYAIANYVSAGGQALEGRGVIPDAAIELTRADLLAGRDPVLEAAEAWIASVGRQSNSAEESKED
jgi:carboxyl-terminal processing protease